MIPLPNPVKLFWHRGDVTDTSLYLIGMAAVGMVLIAIGAK